MNLSGRKRTVTVTFSFDLSTSCGTLSEYKYCGLLRAEEDAGELWPSIDVSKYCFEDDVVEDAGELAALEPNFFDLGPCFDAITTRSQSFNTSTTNSTSASICTRSKFKINQIEVTSSIFEYLH